MINRMRNIHQNIPVVLKPMNRATFVCREKKPTSKKILPRLAILQLDMTVNEVLDSVLVAKMKRKRKSIDTLKKT